MFNSARLKLTAWYLLIIMCISAAFSVVIYRVLTSELDRFSHLQRIRIEQGFTRVPVPPLPSRVFAIAFAPELLTEVKHRLLTRLLFINAGILLVSGATGYFFAGRTLRPIQDMVDEQNQFISDASHELRTPLTSLKSAFEVHLRDKFFSVKDARRLIRESINEVNKLQSLSDGLLQLAQYHIPHRHAQSKKVAISDAIELAIKKVEPLADKKKIVVEQHFVESTVRGNKLELVDLFVILLDNAIKYSPLAKKIEIDIKQEDTALAVTVKDHGIGIGKSDLPHIFDRFYRADSARSYGESHGYGLGLSIAKRIVEAHQGTIQVRSTLGKGTTMIVTLPLFS